MSKIYISALGTSTYNECTYSYDNSPVCTTQHAQIATMTLWECKEWSVEEDRIVLLVTNLAKEKCLEDHLTKDGTPEPGLKTRMIEAGIPWNIVEVVPIADGKDMKEIMDAFMKLVEIVKAHPEAHLYYDVTNALRYIPMLLVVFNNYSRFVYGTSCEHIAYGSFLTPVTINGHECKPIIYLDWLDYIQQWSTAVEQYIHSGDSDYLETLARDDFKLFGRKTRTNLPNRLKDLSDDLLTCQGWALISGKSYKLLLDRISKEEKQNMPRPLIPLMELILDRINYFSPKETWMNGLYAAKWCLEHKMYQQTLTLVQEIGKTYMCMCLGLDWQNEYKREIVKDLVHIISFKKCLYSKEYSLYIDYIKKHEQLKEWIKILNQLTVPRNTFNHGGITNIIPSGTLMMNTEEILERALNIKYTEIEKFKMPELPTNTFFINLSNHPSSNWTQEQKQAALELGKIIDIPFPNVQANWTKEEIDSKAKEIVTQVHQQVEGDTIGTTIHVMGEMNMTFCLVKKFQKIGYRCVASTTERNTTVNPDGSKTSVFHFVAFREY